MKFKGMDKFKSLLKFKSDNKFKGNMKQMDLMVVKKDERMEVSSVNEKKLNDFNDSEVCCMNCQTHFNVPNELGMMPVKALYSNNELHKQDSSEYITCPKCGNTNAIEAYKMHWNAGYVVNNDERYSFKLYGQSFMYTADANTLLYKDAEQFEIYSDVAMTLDDPREFEKDKEILTVKEMVKKYADPGTKAPVRVRVSEQYMLDYVKEGKGCKVAISPLKTKTIGIFIDKRTKLTKIKNGQVINTINLNRMSYEAEDAYRSIMKVLPMEMLRELYGIYLEGIHSNVLNKWELGKLSTVREKMEKQLQKAMLVSYLKNIQVLDKAVDFSQHELDSYSMRKFKAAEREIDVFRSFIPAASKKSAILLKQALVNKSLVGGANSTFLMSLLDNKGSLVRLLENYSEKGKGVTIQTAVNVSANFSEPKKYSFRKVRRILNRYLKPGSIDNAVLDILNKYDKEHSDIQLGYNSSFVFREISSLYVFIIDTIRGLEQFKYFKNAFIKSLEENADIEEIAFKQSIIDNFESTFFYSVRNLHDEVSRVNRKISSGYNEYMIPEHWMKNESVMDGYEIKYIRNTEELFDIAETLNLCVDQYENRIMENRVKILGVYKECVPVLCIEISTDDVIYQIKKHSNERLAYGDYGEEKLIERIKEWITENRFKIDTVDLEGVGVYSNVGMTG